MIVKSQGADQSDVMPLVERSVNANGQNFQRSPVGQWFDRSLNDLGFTKLWILD